MLLIDLVRVSAEVASTRSRTAKTSVVADALSRAGEEEIEVVASYLAGTPRQRRTGLGWRGLETLPDPALLATLEVLEVDAALDRISRVAGAGARARRAEEVTTLFGRATDAEQRFLKALIFENLRQGALDSILLDAVAGAFEVPVAVVRQAAMFTPSSGELARAARAGGRHALEGFGLVPGRPLRPMLAGSAADVATALADVAAGEAVVVDRKLDGIRVQVHRTEDRVRVFTRSLDDVTDRLPEVVESVASLPASALVLDGEVIALRHDGRPRPFQETGSRTASSSHVAQLRRTVPLTVFYFDLLHLDGEDLVDRPLSERLDRLTGLLPAEVLVPRTVTADPEAAGRFFSDSVAAGHEGVVVKSTDAPYAAGRRGRGWVKVKPRHTFDLVVLAVEWGSGRRAGLLSNIHLGARDDTSESGFVMLGKTFKGMTDEMLRWQTERFLTLETHREQQVVHVRPEQVVEVAIDGVQRSSRYPAGMALRFARVLRYRDDKSPEEADTVETVRALS